MSSVFIEASSFINRNFRKVYKISKNMNATVLVFQVEVTQKKITIILLVTNTKVK